MRGTRGKPTSLERLAHINLSIGAVRELTRLERSWGVCGVWGLAMPISFGPVFATLSPTKGGIARILTDSAMTVLDLGRYWNSRWVT